MHSHEADCAQFKQAMKAHSIGHAVHHLKQHGCVVVGVTVHRLQPGRRPVIRIDAPPASAWLRGAMRRRVQMGDGKVHTLMAVPFRGCQVDWEVVTERSLEAQRA